MSKHKSPWRTRLNTFLYRRGVVDGRYAPSGSLIYEPGTWFRPGQPRWLAQGFAEGQRKAREQMEGRR